ncbi:unnamed protein product [Mytilus coruscus]|uniref:C1q domain-containing protein n=1 Tax=Mytilus coruscus TaxID=42192 RepID=A0A6J8B9A4_MYTCO|nr:unnamed protein product [Mytilus coruscus]
MFLLLFVCHSNASIEELETQMNRKFQNMKRILRDQNERIQKLEHQTSQTVEINELNSELAYVKMENSDKQEQISILKKTVFREQLNRKVDPEVHDNLVHLDKNKRLLEGSTFPIPVHTTAFYAYMNQSITTQDQNLTLIFDTVKTNINGGYSPNTEIFRVPVDGVYGFTFSVREGSDGYGSYEIIKNAEAVGSAIGLLEGLDKRLLEGIQPSPIPVHTTAFYAYMNQSLTTQDQNRILIFDTVKQTLMAATIQTQEFSESLLMGVYGLRLA